MSTRIGQAATAIALALAGVGPTHAHHSLSVFELSTSIWVRGTVVRYEPIAPHAMIYLEETTADGQVRRWRVEGPWPARLGWILENNGGVDRGEFFKPGDVIEVCGFDMKAGIKAGFADAPVQDWKFTHGQMVVMPAGHMQSWGGYGKLVNCVRPEDSVSDWIDFLNADPLAQPLWCGSRRDASAATLAPEEFVDAVSSGISRACD